MINYGDRNEKVLALQKQLNLLGIDVGPFDGIFGPKTLAAWTEFDQEYLNDYRIVSDDQFNKLLEKVKSVPQSPTTTETTETKFINLVKPMAQLVMEKTGLPASVSIGQSIIETGYGQSRLAQEARNYHGIKAAFGDGDLLPTSQFPEWSGSVYEAKDDEPNLSRFMSFDNIVDSFWSHDRWFCYWDHYHEYFKFAKDPFRFLKAISKHYATNSSYGDLVWSAIQKHKLTDIDGEVTIKAANLISPWKELHAEFSEELVADKIYRVAIMPGHGGEDTGAINTTLDPGKRIWEKDYNRLEAEEVKRILEAKGNYQVTICRTKEEPRVPLDTYQKRANDTNADICLCLHHNANNGNARGWWLFYAKENGDDKKLAKIMGDKYGTLPLKSRGFEYAGKPFSQDWFSRVFNCIGQCNMPTALFESCFIDNDADCKWLIEDGYKEIANAISNGVVEYFEG